MDAGSPLFFRSSRQYVCLSAICDAAFSFLLDLDPTKLKARQFSRSAAPAQKKPDNSLWTETPAERQQRLADEVSGKKRRAVDNRTEEEGTEGKKRRKDDEVLRKGVDEYTVSHNLPPFITR